MSGTILGTIFEVGHQHVLVQQFVHVGHLQDLSRR